MKFGQVPVEEAIGVIAAHSVRAGQTVVKKGTLVTADIAGDETKFLLGSREIAGTTDIDVYSDQSPLGAAINSAQVKFDGDGACSDADVDRNLRMIGRQVAEFALRRPISDVN